MNQLPDEVLSGAPAIARCLGRSVRSVYDLLDRRQIPAVRVGGQWTSTRNTLRAYVATMAQAGE